jgi:uncharacterized repeat protein (TIGR01451 family)
VENDMSINKTRRALWLVLGAWLLGAAGSATAEDKGCIELQTSAETEERYVDEQGHEAQRLVPAAKIVPGDEVVWTIVAKNVCARAAENIVIANPVPQHMTYVANSALGVGTQISYSIDGEAFQPAEALQMTGADGSVRPARAEDYRAIRWAYAAAFPQGATAFVRYRAIVN